MKRSSVITSALAGAALLITVGAAEAALNVVTTTSDLASIVSEVGRSTLTERGATRADDRISEAAMEDRKKDGYF